MNRGSEGPEIGGWGAWVSSSAHWTPGRQRNGEAEGSEEVCQAMGADFCLVRNERQEVNVQRTKAEGSTGQEAPPASTPAPGFWGPHPGQVTRQPSKESSLDPPGPGEPSPQPAGCPGMFSEALPCPCFYQGLLKALTTRKPDGSLSPYTYSLRQYGNRLNLELFKIDN